MSLFPALTLPPLLAKSPMTTVPDNDPNGMAAASANGPSFGEALQGALGQVNDLQLHAGEMTRAYAMGQTTDIHSVMIASEQASIAMQLTTQVRNKVVDAYQEIMRTSM